MPGTEIEQFLGAGRNLADRQGLPTTQPRLNQSWEPREVHTIKLGTMLGQIAVMPQETNRVSLAGYGGDEEMITKLRARVRDGVLEIEGELPFKPGSAGNFGGGSYNVFGDGVFVSGGSVHIGGNVSMGGSGGQHMLIVNGREVDLSRYIQLALIVPVGTNVQVGDLVGAIGIGPNLGGALHFNTNLDTHIFAYDVAELTGKITGQGRAEVQSVEDSADIKVTGQGSFVLGSVGGAFRASVTGQGTIGQGTISVRSGNSQSMQAQVTGQGSIHHGGTVLGAARLRITGMGDITAGPVHGNVDAKVSGMGNITANGRTYSPRW